LIGEKGAVPETTARRLDLFRRGLVLFREREFGAAAAVFSGLEDDPVASLYRDRCWTLTASPPPDDWDFVFNLQAK
jgi:hypothetical protein